MKSVEGGLMRGYLWWRSMRTLAGAVLTLAFMLVCSPAHAVERGDGTPWRVTEIYLATLGYAPDLEGVDYWVENIRSNPEWTPTTVAQSFFDQPLVQESYPESLGHGPLIESLYQNLFDRPVDDEGLAYWLEALETGRVQRNEMIIALIDGGWGNPEAEQDMARFGNRVRVSLRFMDYQRQQGLTYGSLEEAQQLEFREAGRDVLSGVTHEEATYDGALERIPELLSWAGQPGDGVPPLLPMPDFEFNPSQGQVTMNWDQRSDWAYNVFVSRDADCDISNYSSCTEGRMIADALPGLTVGELRRNAGYHLVLEVIDEEGRAWLQAPQTVRLEMVSAVAPLNDTGIFWSVDHMGGRVSFCDPQHAPGQDCQYGRDAEAAAGTLIKVGGGNAGFDFTKIANDGSELPFSASLGSGPNDWACTRDNVTGLIWEVKVRGAHHLRGDIHKYTWYDPGSPDGNPGVKNGGSCGGRHGPICDTTGFVQAVNDEGLCGASDWRMPTRLELQGIVDYGRDRDVRVDSGYFPNTRSRSFWTGTPSAKNSSNAWRILFSPTSTRTVVDDNDSRGLEHYVRLVRDGE
ncbi:DUF1566 domain-containing protein [Ectothiorhodospira variabilis]|uniref:Lcl domain-containing protein n=1 Tax=Ectothiorhodospira variabilis TaxID=505694 RepID=UPI001EFB1022|nr:DUF1566 domain-containing protein [Ectothiorhodospira variabilis]MCG5499041.1 DUF1566 domain-containing protein [Ectothiorhodospira variabilis]